MIFIADLSFSIELIQHVTMDCAHRVTRLKFVPVVVREFTSEPGGFAAVLHVVLETLNKLSQRP